MEVAKWAGATLGACRSDLARIPEEPEEASIPVVGSDEAETILMVEDDTDFRTHLAGVLRGRPDPGIDLIQKPISQAALANRIRQALDRRRRFGRMVARSLSPLMKSRHSIVSFRVDNSIFRCADALAVCALSKSPHKHRVCVAARSTALVRCDTWHYSRQVTGLCERIWFVRNDQATGC